MEFILILKIKRCLDLCGLLKYDAVLNTNDHDVLKIMLIH